jgi:hypothetical protein
MKKTELIYFILACFGIITTIIFLMKLIMFMAIAVDLRDEVIELKQENTELKQINTELKWELDQVDQMICNNEAIK